MTTRIWRSRCLSAAITTSLLALGGPLVAAHAAGGPNIALGDTASASSSHTEYGAAHVTDGNQGTYWQSAGPNLPQWVQADLGTTTRVDEVVLKLPAGWDSRTQTLSVQGSTDGTSFTTLKSSAGYTFTPGTGNTVTVSFPATRTRFVRVDITANTGWQAAQLSELEVHSADESSADLAADRPLTASSHTQVHTAGNAGDGNRATYWESANNALPQWIQVDLGASRAVNRVVLKLPAGLGGPQPDPEDPGQHQRHGLHRPDVLPGPRLQRGERQHGGPRPRRDHHPARPRTRHGEHGAARRAGLRVRGVRTPDGRHPGPPPRPRTSRSPSRPPTRCGSPGTPPPTTSA
ncbi:hypothetical protein GCM10020295_03810 [Streptomyces cinereospinus]